MRKWLVSLALALALVLAMAACSSDSGGEADTDSNSDEDTGRLAELKEAGTIQVGFADEKPYAYEEDGELKGVAVDVATEVLKSLGIDNVEGHLSDRSEEHTSELQSRGQLVCRLLLEKKKISTTH